MSVEPFDSATDLSKEASDESLWKLKPTPSRRMLRVFVRTGAHTSCVRRSTHNCFDFLAFARTIGHLSMWNLPEAARVPLCRQDDRLRIKNGKNGESDGPSLVWCVCLSPRHARAHQEHNIVAAIDIIADTIAADAPTRVTTRTDSRN